MNLEEIKRYEKIEEAHIRDQQKIMENMSYLTSKLKEGALLTQRIICDDKKKIDRIDKTSSKQLIKMKIENNALKRYYQSAGPRTCYEYLIVIVILIVFLFMAIYIILD